MNRREVIDWSDPLKCQFLKEAIQRQYPGVLTPVFDRAIQAGIDRTPRPHSLEKTRVGHFENPDWREPDPLPARSGV